MTTQDNVKPAAAPKPAEARSAARRAADSAWAIVTEVNTVIGFVPGVAVATVVLFASFVGGSIVLGFIAAVFFAIGAVFASPLVFLLWLFGQI